MGGEGNGRGREVIAERKVKGEGERRWREDLAYSKVKNFGVAPL